MMEEQFSEFLAAAKKIYNNFSNTICVQIGDRGGMAEYYARLCVERMR